MTLRRPGWLVLRTFLESIVFGTGCFLEPNLASPRARILARDGRRLRYRRPVAAGSGASPGPRLAPTVLLPRPRRETGNAPAQEIGHEQYTLA